MNKKYNILIGLLLMILSISTASANKINELYQNNRYPLLTKPYIELPIGAVKPEGWLKDQLIRMKKGMTGNLDILYEKVMGSRNGWLGGDGDVWERGPYWIDGLVPLAYILDDAELKQKVQPWIECVLKSQQPNGYFGPSIDREPEAGLQRNNARDWWPKMVVLKYLVQYYDATGDERIIPFLTKYFQYQLNELPKNPLNHWTSWGRERGGDNLMVVYWLYSKTGDKFLLDLGNIIAQQTTDWTDMFLNKQIMSTLFSVHCVNLAQAMKEPIIRYQYTKDEKHLKAIDKGASDLKRTHGWPTGLYGGDEMLHTGNPTQGSELCTAVEMMFSLEKMLEITGNTTFADWLERVTFNALPTQITDDFDARQYYQQLNQVQISRQDRNFVTPYNGTGQLFGLLTGYPCCTSNLHQGWPKFTRNLWFATEDHGLSALVYSPCTVEAKVADGTLVKITEDTNYPFEEVVRFQIQLPSKKDKSVFFPFHLRIPSWCENANVKVNGEKWDEFAAGTIAKICRTWKNGDKVELELPAKVSVSRWFERSAAIERGPLLYALRIGEKWSKVNDDRKFGEKYGDSYYEVYPTTPWNYCLKENDLKPENIEDAFKVVRKDVRGYPWNLENAPIEIKAKGKRMKEWTLYNGMAGPLPYSPQYQIETLPEEDITLIPYGCTTLRITEFPTTLK
ncbi:beta-L-arabinofuranosidase domain-containing protein [Bacteroides sedimenti]|uniref:Glycoside hydrolase family 127 protein n=1 Tax=Bacteroides sedimenti TaxID=2136147 RepID=A0ABM8IJE5_9BACE